MRIRHITAVANIDAAGLLIDPLAVRHGMVVAGRIAELAGPIDPLTHLNHDFPEHGLDDCLVAERLERGAALLRDGDRFTVARAHPAAYARRGPVDRDARRIAWQQARAKR